MKVRVVLSIFILSVIVIIGSSACRKSKSYTLKCNIRTEGYNIYIEGESGEFSIEFHNEETRFTYVANTGQRETTTLNLNRTLTYKDTGNEYKITGKIVVNEIKQNVSYEVTATGGGFGDEKQTCKSP